MWGRYRFFLHSITFVYGVTNKQSLGYKSKYMDLHQINWNLGQVHQVACMHQSVIMDINTRKLMSIRVIDEVQNIEHEKSVWNMLISTGMMIELNGPYQNKDNDDEVDYNCRFLCAFCENMECDYLCPNGGFTRWNIIHLEPLCYLYEELFEGGLLNNKLNQGLLYQEEDFQVNWDYLHQVMSLYLIRSFRLYQNFSTVIPCLQKLWEEDNNSFNTFELYYFMEGIGTIINHSVFNVGFLERIGIWKSSLGLPLSYNPHYQNQIEIIENKNNCHFVNMDPWVREGRNDVVHGLLARNFNGLAKQLHDLRINVNRDIVFSPYQFRMQDVQMVNIQEKNFM